MSKQRSPQEEMTDRQRIAIPANFLASRELVPVSAGMPAVCTWPLTESKGRARLHQVLQGAGPTLWDLCEHGSFRFVCNNLAAAFREFESEDKPGELIQGPMYFLVGPVMTYHSGSEGIFDSLMDLALLEGYPPWEPGVILQAERVPTRRKRTRMALTFIDRGNKVPDDDP